MIYLQSKTILVTIRVLNLINRSNPIYLVGDTIYETLVQQLTKNIFLSANWNRALKYGTDFYEQKKLDLLKKYDFDLNQEPKIGYYKFSFDLYYDETNNLLKILAKNSFDQQIVNQTSFVNFLNYLIEQTNVHKAQYKLTIPNDVWTNNLVNIYEKNYLQVKSLTHFVVSDPTVLENHKVKYKYLVVSGNETKVEITNHQQIIYTYNANKTTFSKDQFSYLDLVNNVVYLHGILKTKNQNPLCLSLNYENEFIVNQLKTQILDQFSNYFADKHLKLIHFFNITGDLSYLIQELNSYQHQSYSEILTSLDQKFDLTKSNHYPFIYQQFELRQILFKTVKTNSELKDYHHQVTRFGVMQKSEVEAVEAKFKQLR